MNIEIAHTLRMLIVGILVYVVNVSIGGFGESWIAEKVGDTAPRDLGYKTLDPAPHFSFFWCTFMLIGLVFGKSMDFFRGVPGVGSMVPIAPQALIGRHAKIRAIVDFFGRAIIHLLLFICVFTFIIIPLFSYLDVITTTSFLDAVRLISFMFYAQNLALFNIYCTIGLCRSILYFYFPHVNLFSMENVLLMFVLWMGVAFFITPYIVEGILLLMSFVGIIDQKVSMGIYVWQKLAGI